MKKSLLAPWELDAKKSGKPKMLLCHFSEGELEGLDTLQGFSHEGEGGFRDYSALAPIVALPEVQEIFRSVSKDLKHDGKMSKDLQKEYKKSKAFTVPYEETPAEQMDPALDALEKEEGEGGDSKRAWIPMNLAELLIECGHKPDINKETGDLQFKFWKKFIRIASSVAGATLGTILGGPGAGTAIGAGLGRTAGGMATGQKFKKAALRGATTGAMVYGAHGLGQMAGLTAATPGTLGMFGGNNALSNLAGSAGIGSLSNQQGVRQDAGQELQKMNGGQQGNGQSQGSGTPMMDMLFKAGPLAAAGAAYLGDKRKYKSEKADRNELIKKQEAYEKKNEINPQYWDSDYIKQRTKKFGRMKNNPAFFNPSQHDLDRGIFNGDPFLHEPGEGHYAKGGLVQSYTQGVLVKGKGKGQDDVIKTEVPALSYISDASATSGFGDGSSEAGAAALKDLEIKIKKKFPKKVVKAVEKQCAKKLSLVPVWLSNDEYKFDPVTVTLLGNGSNKKGSDKIRKMIVNLRKHKISKGDKLPPKAKTPLEYMNMRTR